MSLPQGRAGSINEDELGGEVAFDAPLGGELSGWDDRLRGEMLN
jgi:hypothetical protein